MWRRYTQICRPPILNYQFCAMIILGIDPGSSRIGYGVVTNSPSPKFVGCGLIEIHEQSSPKRLAIINKKILVLITRYKPELIGIEKIYASKNIKTVMGVAESRGVIVLSASSTGVPIIECSPSEVKLSVTGYGLADKRTVAEMVQKILRIAPVHGPDDITDALAIALTAGAIYKNSL